MDTVYVPLHGCKKGDVLATNVFDGSGKLIARENTELNEYIFGRLSDCNIRTVSIRPNDAGTPVQKVLKYLISGTQMDHDLLFREFPELFEGREETRIIADCLSRLREADQYTYIHSVNVGVYSMLLAQWMELPFREVFGSAQAGLLHDIGKSLVDRSVLNKAERLTYEEFEEIKLHTVYGFNLLRDYNSISYDVKKTVLMHHEREDGSGYPIHSQSQMINLYSKIVAITDVYDVMTSDRVYKKGASPFEAFRMFLTSGKNLFDNVIRNTFLDRLSVALIGTSARLPSGEYGRIAYIPPDDITNPVVMEADACYACDSLAAG